VNLALETIMRVPVVDFSVSRRSLPRATTLPPTTVPTQVSAQSAAILPKRSARDRLEQALARIADPNGEGARACLTVYAETARAAADAADARARAGISLGPFDGTIVSIKDLFDVAGEPTRAGTKVLADAPPALADAQVVRRLRAAGGVIVAKTNMPEFAFASFGRNPHYGTPGNPSDRSRDPGGSSSGAAVAVADGMCEIAIGSDTGGSIRRPAAFCGVVGFKPTKSRVPTEGVVLVSFSLDTIGPLARSVADCVAADAIMSGEAFRAPEPAPLTGLRLAIPETLAQGLDETVNARFSSAATALRNAGTRLTQEPLALLAQQAAAIAGRANFLAVEGYALHRELFTKRGQEIDPIARTVFERARDFSAADYIALTRERARLVRAMDEWLEDFDAVVLPTMPFVAPKMSEVETPEGYFRTPGARNTNWVNFFDLCAISIPLPREGGLPVGLMLVSRNKHDHRLLAIAAAVERLLAG
jgi:aspartyl-tRNA(Asn)/glutamyl-tRNA(Gln) amidotransferase subunit A